MSEEGRPFHPGGCTGEIDDYPRHPDSDGAGELLRRQDPLSPFVVRALNPEASYDEIKSELTEIGYPKS